MARFILSFLFFGTFLVGAQVTNQIGGRQSGLANTAGLIVDVWAIKNNPAAFGMSEHSGIGLQYQNRFLIPELSIQNLAIGYHSSAGNFGLYYQQFGFELFRQIQLGVGYGLKLSDKFAAGVNINYHFIRLGDIYGSKYNMSAGLGIFYKPVKKVVLGASVLNVNRARLADYQDERLPTVLIISAQYAVTNATNFMIDFEKEITSPLNIKGALEVKTSDKIKVMIGINSNPFLSAFGCGINLKKLTVFISASWHTRLGLLPGLGLDYQLK